MTENYFNANFVFFLDKIYLLTNFKQYINDGKKAGDSY